MNSLNSLNKYDKFFIFGLLLWLIETGLFGWNRTSQSVAESMFNNISFTLMIYGAVGGIAAAVKTVITVNNPPGTTSEVK